MNFVTNVFFFYKKINDSNSSTYIKILVKQDREEIMLRQNKNKMMMRIVSGCYRNKW